MIVDSLYKRLSEDSGVSAIVGTRVYPVVVPQQVYNETSKHPCLVYSLDTDGRQVTFSGTNNLVAGRLVLDCYAQSYRQVKLLANAAREALVDFSGYLFANTSPLSSVYVSGIHLSGGETDLMEEEPGMYHVMQRYTVWYRE